MTLDQLIGSLESWFPPELAEAWDNTGLLLGDRSAPVRRVMTCLTITAATAREAIEEKVDLVVSHHPIFFKPVGRLTADGPVGFLYAMARTGVAVYSPHTSFDSAAGGINELLAARLGLKEQRPLRPAPLPTRFKLSAFVPDGDLDRVQTAVFAAGAGVIGEYSECGFRLQGTGTFRGSDAANPTVGQRGRREQVAEHRLEVLVPDDRLSAVVAALRAAHSYEEPAFDVYPLHPTSTSRVGGGRFGVLPEPMELGELAARVKRDLSAGLVQYVGDADRKCAKVAVGCGSAMDFFAEARKAGCDAFVTGEARFHDCLRAEDEGMGLVLAGHYATERFAVEMLAGRIAAEFPSATVWASRSERDPLQMSV